MTKPQAPRSRRMVSGSSSGRKGWMVGGAALAVVVVAAVAIVSAGGGAPEDAAPDIALPNFHGETVRLSDFGGQGVVVNYWASWCLPCLAELPGFEQVYRRHRGDVAFLGINLADDPSSALAVVADTGISYPLAIDADGATFAEFGGLGMPTTVFISPDGLVLERYSGNLTAEQLETKIVTYFGT